MLFFFLIFLHLQLICSIAVEEATSDYDYSLLELERALAQYVNSNPQKRSDDSSLYSHNAFNKYFGWQTIIVGVAVSVIALFGIAILVTGLVRRRRNTSKRFAGSTRSTSPHDSILGFDAGDKKLAHSAQMYHYQHQKQQMLAIEKSLMNQNDNLFSEDLPDEDSEQEIEENEVDHTVFECPGLAPTGDLEVKNPLFQGEMSDESGHFRPTQPGLH
ncbi:neural proliferation, differentiation and control, 1 [Cichlidogyrus casuarinus]|uniref:Neural proliferation, differentiation and control, 1 n=1 Tax=Cichlidogyrus casuarinus TaxID=1844966 RepID=A0ABD2PSD5_9PLAT